MNERTSIMSLCNLTKEALWKESMVRIHTVPVPQCSIAPDALCFLVLWLDFHLCAILSMLACVYLRFVWVSENKLFRL